jgi:hypothetical protein
MTLLQWLAPRSRKHSSHALIRVEPGEAADAEAMLGLLDGKESHFGLTIRLIKAGELPPNVVPQTAGNRPPEERSYAVAPCTECPSVRELPQHARYYQVYVERG